jgi:hypothetical protein
MRVQNPLTVVTAAYRLNHLWPSTADARGACTHWGGQNSWFKMGNAVHTKAGWCSNIKTQNDLNGIWGITVEQYQQ